MYALSTNQVIKYSKSALILSISGKFYLSALFK